MGKFNAEEAAAIAKALAPSQTKSAKPGTPQSASELKITEELLGKVQNEMSATHAKLADELQRKKETHPDMLSRRAQISVLEQEAERLCAIVRQGAAKQ